MDDNSPLSRQEQELVETNLPLIKWEVKRQRPRDESEGDEWHQEGVLGLIRALRTYREEHGSLANWITLNIRYKIWIFRNTCGLIRLPKVVGEDNKCHADRARSVVMAGGMDGVCLGGSECDDRDDGIEIALSKLREKDREILDLYFVQNMVQRDIAEKLGITHQRVSQRLREALDRFHISYTSLI